MKRTSLLLSLALLGGLTLTGCMPVASPLTGIIYTETKFGTVATDASVANREGRACGTTILGWVAQGDASIQAAKANGGVNTVASVDHYAKNILGIYAEFCTIVRGS